MRIVVLRRIDDDEPEKAPTLTGSATAVSMSAVFGVWLVMDESTLILCRDRAKCWTAVRWPVEECVLSWAAGAACAFHRWQDV